MTSHLEEMCTDADEVGHGAKDSLLDFSSKAGIDNSVCACVVRVAFSLCMDLVSRHGSNVSVLDVSLFGGDTIVHKTHLEKGNLHTADLVILEVGEAGLLSEVVPEVGLPEMADIVSGEHGLLHETVCCWDPVDSHN